MWFLFQIGSIRRSLDRHSIAYELSGFYSKLVRLEVGLNEAIQGGATGFLFQIGSIRSAQIWVKVIVSYCSFYSKLVRLEVLPILSVCVKYEKFLFQIGSIRRLSENDMYMITNPHSCCQVNFGFARIFGVSAVDLQSCKFSGRLTAVCPDCVYRHFLPYFVRKY